MDLQWELYDELPFLLWEFLWEHSRGLASKFNYLAVVTGMQSTAYAKIPLIYKSKNSVGDAYLHRFSWQMYILLLLLMGLLVGLLIDSAAFM